jgi:chromosome partitioning protein
MRVVLFSQFKGGVGKTTCAINVASALCSHHSVVLLDGDRNRSAKQWASQGKLKFPVVNESEEIPNCDLLIIDSAANINEADLLFLAKKSNLTILPSSLEDLSLGALWQTWKTLDSSNIKNCRVLLTMCPSSRKSRAFQEASQALQERGLSVFPVGIRRYAAHVKAVNQGVCVGDVKGDRCRMKAWQDFLEVRSHIEGVLDESIQ